MIKYVTIFAIIFFCLFGSEAREECSSYTINYMDWKMIFPSTVGEAVIMHQLDYRPPGYYYKKIAKNKGELILTYDYNKGDFHDEYQPKETLFPRQLDSYMFRFPEKAGLQDSLRVALEKSYGKEFRLTKATSPPKAVMKMNYDLFFLEVDSCMTIGLASSPEIKKNDRSVIVRFLYKHSPEKRISAMRGFLL